MSAVYAHPLDWEDRGQYVYDTLVATADASQAEARQLLDAKGLKHTTFLIGTSYTSMRPILPPSRR